MASSPACLRRSLLACSRLRAPISTSARLQAGHNKWSKIRHEKGAADRKRGAQNNLLAKAITDASRSKNPPTSPEATPTSMRPIVLGV